MKLMFLILISVLIIISIFSFLFVINCTNITPPTYNKAMGLQNRLNRRRSKYYSHDMF